MLLLNLIKFIINLFMFDFCKYHGLGNDYIIINPKLNLNLYKNNIKLLCNRNFGMGGDGILYGPFIFNNKIYVKIFNSDGSEIEKSGNGLRIFSFYLLEYNYVKKNSFYLNIKSSNIYVEIVDILRNIIKIELGIFTFSSEAIPTIFTNEDIFQKNVKFFHYREFINCVNIGNPHCVIIKKTINSNIIKKLGRVIENSQYFPNGINCQIVKIINRKMVEIEIWERGVGYTLASGTSSVAAFLISNKLGLVDNEITVKMVGGDANISLINNNLFLTAPVNKLFYGNLANSFKKELRE